MVSSQRMLPLTIVGSRLVSDCCDVGKLLVEALGRDDCAVRPLLVAALFLELGTDAETAT